MTAACDLLEVELALDRIDAELAAELPPHMRAFAAAHAQSAAPPPAPAVLQRASTLAMAQHAQAHPLLADRGLAIARLAVPIAIEDDRRVVAARAVAPAWDAYAALAAARDEASRERFGAGYVATLHRLNGVTIAASEVSVPQLPPEAHAWHAPHTAPTATIHDVWRALAERHDVEGSVEIRRAAVKPRTFVVEPQRRVIVVVPDTLASPAARFAVLHELGHAVVALLARDVPRVVDEAAASFVARGMEDPAHPWHSSLAAGARARRRDHAMVLDAIERGAPLRPSAKPPWALWHDPAAQAAYVEAEAIADRFGDDLAASIAAERARIDAST